MKAAHRVSEEYARFTDALGRILRVPYSAMKAKLEAEKKRKKREPKKTSASRDSGA